MNLHLNKRIIFLDCGGKRSATPLSPAARTPKALSPLRSASAVQITVAAIMLAFTLAFLAGCSKHDDHAGHDHSGHSDDAKPAASTAAKCPHDAPKELCFICDPALRDKGRLWCDGHARYEDRCWLCHPELEDKNRLWCKEHSLYEDECFLCHPELKPQASGSQTGAAGTGLFCNEHGVFEAECGICRPDAAASLKIGEGLKVRLPSTNSARIAGIETAPPQTGAAREAIECYAEIEFNQNKLAKITTPVGGIVQSVEADLGSHQEENQVLARIWSASIAEAVAKAVLTHQTLERERRLRAERVTPQRELDEAEAASRAASQQLRTLGFTEAQIDELGNKPNESVLLEVRAPFAGEIVERSAVRGQLVETGKALFTLADTGTMWAMLNISEAALSRVRVGQTVEIAVDSLPDRTFTGKLTWIASEVDERTRMARARAELSNPDGLLKARMFARARIVTKHIEGAVLVPPSAIQHVEGRAFVFVRAEDDLFEARVVELGAVLDGRQEVRSGLRANEPVAVAGGYALKSQLLISRLGAGCADH